MSAGLNYGEAHAAVKLRALEIESELAEMKRRYVVDGVQGDFKVRATLEAELAALAVQQHRIRAEEAAAKVAAKEVKTQRFLDLLCKKIEDAGLTRLIDEARSESLEYIKEQGLYDAYSKKVSV